MTNHFSATQVSDDSGVLPNQSFFSWLKSQTLLFVSQILGFISFIAALFYYSLNGFEHLRPVELFHDPNSISLAVDYAQIFFIVIFIFALIRILDDNKRGSYRVKLVYERVFNPASRSSQNRHILIKSKLQLRKFKHYFLFFWCAMLLLYISFTVTHSFNPHELTPINASGVRFFNFALNNISMLFVFFCFLILSSPPHDEESKKKFKRYIIQSTVGMIAFTTIFFFPYLTPTVCDALSGLLNAVVLAILIARLDSKLIGLPSWLISVLYFYSALQPFFMLFEREENQLQGIETAVLILVLIFKIYFFLIITYTLQTGRMLNYLICFPSLNEGANSVFDKKVRITSIADDKTPGLVSENHLLSGLKFFPWIKKPLTNVLGIGVLISLVLSYPIAKYQLANNEFNLEFYLYWVHVLCLPFIVAMMFIWVLGPRKRVSYLVRKLRLDKAFPAGPAYWLHNRLGYSGQQFNPDEAAKAHIEIFGDPLGSTQNEALATISESQLKDFKRYFLIFWSAMLILYISFVLKVPDSGATGIPADSEFKRIGMSFLSFALNNLGMLPLFWCFVVLYLPSHEGGSAAYDREYRKRQSLLINYSLLTIALLIASFPLLLFFIKTGGSKADALTNYFTAFQAVSATLNAVVLALLIARLDSKLIGLPSPLILILYLYSAIQIFYVLRDLKDPVFQNLLTGGLIVVFILKIYLFLVIMYAIDTGRMLNYLFCFPFLSTRVNSVFDNQFEIRTHREAEGSFNFSIRRKNVLIYFTDMFFKRREDCDQKINDLRELMKHEKWYIPDETSGTHWIKIVDAKKNVICQSISLRSKDEANEVIEESIEKIPYCKYDRG